MHLPVLQKEVLRYLNPKPNENFIDCTFGEGGHSRLILEKIAPHGKILGIELSPELIDKIKFQVSSFKFQENLILVNDSYVNLKEIVKKHNFRQVKGILFDLGMSSWHLEESGRGFSFQKDEPLDMRYDINVKCQMSNVKNINQKSKIKQKYLTAETIVNNWSQKEIEDVLTEYGQERFAKSISKEIVSQRRKEPIKTTFQLVEVIKRATPAWYHHKKIHPATKTFQALRIAVNDELDNLKNALPQSFEVLEKGGRVVVISFQGLEDKIVKTFFKNEFQRGALIVLTKKPIMPFKTEVQLNPRSRSAKLRAAEKL